MAAPTGNHGKILHPLYILPLNEGCAEQESGSHCRGPAFEPAETLPSCPGLCGSLIFLIIHSGTDLRCGTTGSRGLLAFMSTEALK